MTDQAISRYGRDWAMAGSFGAWAAAIGLAPTLEAKAVIAAPAILIPGAWWTVARAGRWLAAFFFTSPPLPIALGDSGPHVCMLIAALGLVAGLVRLREWRIPMSSLHAAMAALWGV